MKLIIILMCSFLCHLYWLRSWCSRCTCRCRAGFGGGSCVLFYLLYFLLLYQNDGGFSPVVAKCGDIKLGVACSADCAWRWSTEDCEVLERELAFYAIATQMVKEIWR